MNTRGILWDLDGTLVDSAGDLIAAINHTLGAHHLPALGDAVVRARIGNGAEVLVRRCVEAAGGRYAPAHLEDFLLEYGAHLADRTVVFPPGLRSLLDRLDRPMAVVTNKPEAATHALLAALDLARYFSVVLGGDSTPTRKPDPGMLVAAMARLGVSDADMVGDGDTDVAAGHAAGLRVIGVGWGIGDPSGADVHVETVADLERVLAVPVSNRYP